MKIVLANGCFDPLHAGHVRHLIEASTLGDELWVALTVDAAVRKEKGPGRPVHCWQDRAELLAALRCVARVVPSENGVEATLRYRPAVFVKGIDYDGVRDTALAALRRACESVGAELRFTGTPKMSSAETIRRMRA